MTDMERATQLIESGVIESPPAFMGAPERQLSSSTRRRTREQMKMFTRLGFGSRLR
ncbi:MAG: hypothetical protein ACLVKI_13395 [Gordonibacter urolithinfaciens]